MTAVYTVRHIMLLSHNDIALLILWIFPQPFYTHFRTHTLPN